MRLMVTLLLLTGFFLGMHNPASGEVIENGIYLNSDKASAPRIKTQDGKELHVGAKRTLKIQKSELVSENNTNTRFFLQLTMPYEKNLDASDYLLIVNGIAYRQSGGGAAVGVTSDIDFFISGVEQANQVAKYLGTPVVTRKHPQYNLCVSFTPTKPEFRPGEEVIATLKITNVGTTEVAFMLGGHYGTRDNQYVFSARYNGKQVADIGSSDSAGGLAGGCVLKPGQSLDAKISLRGWFAFDKPGQYEIHGAYHLDFMDAPDFRRTLWEDYASADFEVTRSAK